MLDRVAAPARRGLTSADAAARLRRDGPNVLPEPHRTLLVVRLAGNLVHFFALMLWFASGLALVAGLPELSVAIALVIVVNGVFAFLQEERAGRAADRLRALLPLRVGVRRDGHRTVVDSRDVVVGDVLLLESGDRVPSDAEILTTDGLVVDTSLLTGESMPSRPESGTVLAGMFVVEGDAELVTTATGASTRLAGITQLTALRSSPVSPLTLALNRVVRTVAIVAIGVGVVFFLLSTAVGDPVSDGVVLAIGVTVALVPEALLPTVTLSLAWGAEQMAKRKVLVRHLDAVETLGSTTFICTDKTGTLTRNEMTVVHAWTPAGTASVDEPGYEPSANVRLSCAGAGPAIGVLARAAARCSTGYVHQLDGQWRARGDPMEAALDAFARRLAIDTDAAHHEQPEVARFAFDPRRRRMSVVVDGTVIVKGAPDSVLPRCADPGSGVDDALAHLADRGLRILAVAVRALGHGDGVPVSADEAESELRLLGLMALEDPPRTDVKDSIERCRGAGVAVAMITGDHPTTAAAIATEVGLRRSGDPVIVGDDLPTDETALGALLDHDGIVVARVAPEDKLRIASALRARGHVVAMTGDGVNDGPALHEADIGIAMGVSGTDVAREAADLVLLDDHFATIVAGIEQGRATYVNIRRFLTYHLTDNVAELTPFLVWALSGGRFPLALGVLQILTLDLATDTLSATALGAEPPAPNLLDGPPVSGPLLNGTVAHRAFVVAGPTIALGTMVAFVASYLAAGWRPGDSFPTGDVARGAAGAAFMTVVIAQTANAFACRSTSRWPGALGWTTNRLLVPAASIELGLALTALFVGPIAPALDHAAPPLAGWLVAFATAGAVLVVDAVDKRARGRRRAT